MRGNNARGMLQFLNSRELIGLMSLNLDRVVPMGGYEFDMFVIAVFSRGFSSADSFVHPINR